MKRMLPSVAAVVAIGLIAAVSAGAKSSDSRLTGAGSTFVSPLVSLWAADYASKTGTQIAYALKRPDLADAVRGFLRHYAQFC